MKTILKKLTVLGLLLAMLMVGVTGCGNDTEKKDDGSSAAGTEATADGASADGASEEEADNGSGDASAEEIPAPEGYHLVWNDEFDGDTLNEDDWNRETHEVGWVNNELQEYVPSDEFAFVKDGELIIQPKKEESNGTVSYKSGRINTQNKHDIKYGRIEARLRVPEGKGFLPAFWMMPQDEDHFTANVTVTVSPQFFGWVTALGSELEITGPSCVRDEYREYLRGIMAHYRDDAPGKELR